MKLHVPNFMFITSGAYDNQNLKQYRLVTYHGNK